MKKLFLILCLSAATINAMDEDLKQLYSLQTIQGWGTELNQVSEQLTQYFLALTKDTPSPQMEAAYNQADEKFTKIQSELTQWNQRMQTPEGLSMLNNLPPDHIQAMRFALESRHNTLGIIELKYAAIRQEIFIKAKKEARSNESLMPNILPAACIGAGCGLILAGVYAYATSQNQ